ncbi:MAG: hypothetical protein ACI8UO_003149 [Verrucomicrobiales bacterium]|jgi:hypothetical protein
MQKPMERHTENGIYEIAVIRFNDVNDALN